MGFAASFRSAACAIVALTPGAVSTDSFAEQVGTASAVNPSATINARTIVIGSSITHKERVRTQANGSVQILFVDKTSMTIGPNSDITIDEYVFDPKAGTGALAATVGKGAMRFVGGLISHTGRAEIQTASATIGIRGGVALINGSNIYVGYGSSTVTAGGSSVTLAAGEFTTTARGAPPTPPGPPPSGFVAAQIQAYQSAGGQTGGVPRGTASPSNVAAAETRATGSSGASVAGSLTPQTTVTTGTTGQTSQATTNLTQTIQTSAQAAAVQVVGPPIDLHPTVTLSGFVGGIDRFTSRGRAEYESAAGMATVALDSSVNKVRANFTAFGNPSETLNFGTLDPSSPTESTYADYNSFSAKSPKGSTFNGASYSGDMSNVSPASTRQAVGNPNLTVCQCEFTRWGFWKVENLGLPETIYGNWVAGRPTQIADVPTTGRATYAGHAVAYVADTNVSNGVQRLVSGNFTNTVDFGARTGSVAITNLDSTNYSGTVNLGASDPRNFGGTLAGNIGNRNAILVGSFFRAPTNPVGEMGGTIALSGTNYLGGGIFAAAVKR